MNDMSPIRTEEEISAENTSTRRKFWGIIAISVLAFLSTSYVLVNLIRGELTTAAYILISVYVIAIVLSVTTFILAIRHQVDLALTIIFYYFPIFSFFIPF